MHRLLKHSAVRFVLLIAAVACLELGILRIRRCFGTVPVFRGCNQERVEDGEVVLDYETEHLRVFAVSRQQGEVELYAVKRRMGFGFGITRQKKHPRISYVGNDAYIYLVEKTGSTGIALCLESEDGGRIDPLKSAPGVGTGVLTQGPCSGGVQDRRLWKPSRKLSAGD